MKCDKDLKPAPKTQCATQKTAKRNIASLLIVIALLCLACCESIFDILMSK